MIMSKRITRHHLYTLFNKDLATSLMFVCRSRVLDVKDVRADRKYTNKLGVRYEMFTPVKGFDLDELIQIIQTRATQKQMGGVRSQWRIHHKMVLKKLKKFRDEELEK